MLEGYITPLLTSYLNKYIKNIKPSDLKLSFWGGDAVLTNLELKLDAIEESLKSGTIPFTLKSGCVKQLTIHIPWTAIGSESIIITLDSVECTLKLNNLSDVLQNKNSSHSSSPMPKHKTTPTDNIPSEQAPSYVSGLLSRIGNNIVIKVTNLLLKIIEEHSDILFSISIKELEWFTANQYWKQHYVYTDNLSGDYNIYKVCLVTGATVCLDVIGGSGQVEVYDEPFIPNCNFECRWRMSYHGNVVSENRFEVFVKELEFSVSEQQFVSFLHFVDWLLAMYYSMKKLKGRDEKDDSQTEEPSSNISREVSPEASPVNATPTQTTPSSDDAEWGSWLMSLVSLQGESTTPTNIATTPTTLPSLSLGFYIQLLTINFKVTRKRPHPVFFSNIRTSSWSVMKLKFDGCSCRVNKIPTLKHLGVSLGIMAVNGWIGGACPCTLVTMAMRKYQKISNHNSDNIVHVFTLGSETIDIQPLVVHSLFTEEEGVVTTPTPHTYWLQYKPEYKGVWFTYDYYDINEEREIETCEELIQIGPQFILLSPDVVHRLEFFLKRFISSLEATPLVSQGLTVLGDPRAITNLSITSETINISFPFNIHLLSNERSHDPIKKSHDLDSVPNLLLTLHKISVTVSMAMYSGNATPTHPQQSLVKGVVQQISLSGHKTCQTGFETCQTRSDVSIHELVFDIHSNGDGSSDGSSLYLQINLDQSKLHVSFLNLSLFFAVCYSWSSFPRSLSSLPFSSFSSTHTINTAIRGILSSLNIQFYRISNKQTISVYLKEISFDFISASEDIVTLLSSPAPTERCVDIDHVTSGHVTSDERVFEGCLVLSNEEGEDSPSITFKLGGVIMYLPTLLLNYLESYIPVLVQLWSALQCTGPPTKDTTIISMDRPDPEGIQSLIETIPPNSLSFDDDEEERDERDEREKEEEKEEESKKKNIFTFIQTCSIDVNCEHVLILLPSSQSQAPPPNTPLDLINILLNKKQQQMVVFALPRLQISTTPTNLCSTSLQHSWKINFINFGISVLINDCTSHMLHPLSISVSVVPVQSPGAVGVSGGVVGYGIHADVDVLQMTFEEQQIMLIREVTCNISNISSLLSPPSPPSPSPSPLVHVITSQVQQLPSPIASSPHLSIPPPLLPLSDSSTSLFSLQGAVLSLWLQLTMGKLIVGVCPSEPHPLVPRPPLDDMYLIEGDEISLSFDLQEKRNNFQLKLSSLEIKTRPKETSCQIFTKLFSSHSTVVTTTVAKEIERQFGGVLGSTGRILSPSSFLLIDIVTFQNESKATLIKAQVQTFEAVVWIPLIKSVLEILNVVKDITKKEENKIKEDSVIITNNYWPNVDIKFHSFHVIFPTAVPFSPLSPPLLSSSPLSPSILLFGLDGFTISSHFDYPISRMIVNSSALRRLNIAVAEKRTPPLPGYHMTLYSAQLIGIKHLNFDKFTSFPISLSTDIKLIYSPSLYISPKGSTVLSHDKLLVACGHLLEIHVVSKVILICGQDQVDCIMKVTNNVILLIDQFTHQTPSCDEKHSITTTANNTTITPWQILITGKMIILSMSSLEEEREDGEKKDFNNQFGTFQFSLFNPVLMVTMTTNNHLNIDFSLFDMVSGYHDDGNVMETREGALNSQNGLPAGLITIKWKRRDNEAEERGQSLSIEMNHSVQISISCQLVSFLLKYYHIIEKSMKQNLTSGKVKLNEEKDNVPGMDLSNFELSVSTRQVVIIIQGSDTKGSDAVTKGSDTVTKGSDTVTKGSDTVTKGSDTVTKGSDTVTKGSDTERSSKIILSWETLTVGQPHSVDGSSSVSQNINMFQTQLSVEGLELSIIHKGSKGATKMIPYTIVTCDMTHFSPCSTYDSGQFQVSLKFNWFKVVFGLMTIETIIEIINDYSSLTNELIMKNEKEKSTEDKGKREEEERKEEKRKEKKVLTFHDDLRVGGSLTLITDNIEAYSVPLPGEVRFYIGGNTVESPAACMMWCYKEGRSLTDISILPVPLGIIHEEDWPIDMRVICELSYYTNNNWVGVATLHLSEVSSVSRTFIDLTAAKLWKLSLVGLEWPEGTDINRVSLPLSNMSTVSILSPLVLAGCTCVNSSCIRDQTTTICIDFVMSFLEVTFIHEPNTKENVKRLYEGHYQVLSDLLDSPCDLFQLTAAEFKGNMEYSQHELFVELACNGSVLYMDMSDLVWRYLLYPTQLNAKLTNKSIKQDQKKVSLSLNSTSPALARISPAFLYMVSMTTKTLLRQSDNQEVGMVNSLLASPYIIINKSSIDLAFKQVSSNETISLPSCTCYGYNWKYPGVVKRLHLSYSEYKWSSEFNIDREGIQKLSLEDDVHLYVSVTSNGGIQKLVTFEGGLRICSHLSENVFVKLISEGSFLNDTSQLIVISPGRSVNGVVYSSSGSSLCVNGFNKNERESNSCANTISLTVTSGDPNLLKIPIDDEREELIYCWCNVSMDSYILQVTIAPLFEVCNYLPIPIQSTLTSTLITSITTTNQYIINLPPNGVVTSLQSHLIQPDIFYDIQFTADGCPSLSPPISISTSLYQKLPKLENECTGLSTCTHDHVIESTRCQDVDVPTKVGVVKCRIMLWRRKEEGTVRMELIPQLVLINNTMDTVLIKRKTASNIVINLPSNQSHPLSSDEEIIIITEHDGIQLATNSLSLSNLTSQRLELISDCGDSNYKCKCKLLLNIKSHNNIFIVTLQSLFVIINQTEYDLRVFPSLDHHHAPLATTFIVPSNQTRPLLKWYYISWDIKSSCFIVRVSVSGEEWSIPLSLNFVRRSFTLPTSSGPYPCLLTTHEDNEGHYYIVFSFDPKPRLILANHTSLTLQLIESGVQEFHAHPQTLYSGFETYFEPPSLAKLYPIINENGSTKTLSDIWIQLRYDLSTTSCDLSTTSHDLSTTSHDLSTTSHDLSHSTYSEWSSPVLIQYDTQQYIMLSSVKLLLSSSHHNGTLYISLLPTTSDPLPILTPYNNQLLINKSLSLYYTVQCSFQQLIASFDKEDMSYIEPEIRMSIDDFNISISHSFIHTKLCIDVGSCQIDQLQDGGVIFPVVAIPRYDYYPPVQMIESEKTPFVVLMANWIREDGGVYVLPEVNMTIMPLSVQIDDMLISVINKLITSYKIPSLSYLPPLKKDAKVPPLSILTEVQRDRQPIIITKLNINPITLYLSVHLSHKLSISCDESLIVLSPFSLEHIFSNWSEISRVLASHYSLSLISQAGWIIGSLDLLGSPVLVLNNIRSGLKDFLTLPYEGITRGPGFFILGLGHGLNSLISGISGGIVRSMTNFTTGVAENIERLSLDPEHVNYQEALRRKGQRSDYLGAGLITGASGFGMSIFSALAGIIEQPLSSIHQSQDTTTLGYTKNIASGVGKGLIGVVTKPVGGALQLVSATGNEIINVVGFRPRPQLKCLTEISEECCGLINKDCLLPSENKYREFIIREDPSSRYNTAHLVTTSFTGMLQLPNSSKNRYKCFLYLNSDNLIAINIKDGHVLHKFPIANYNCVITSTNSEKTTLVLKLLPEEGTTAVVQEYTGQVERFLHCTQTGAIQIPENDDDNSDYYQIILNTGHVLIFLSLFTRTRIHLQNSKEYFIMFR